MNIKFFEVGGCVRDSFLGRKSKDIDFTVEAPSFAAMRDAVLARGGEIFLETPQFLTIRANVPGLGAADFVMARRDSATSADGRHPDFVEPGTLIDDLARRDFTMNAIARAEDGTIIDPFNGREAIALRTINAVGNASQRFSEDGLRMLRAMRFSVVLGFRMSPSVVSAIDASLLGGVSTERMREEIEKMFRADTIASMVLFEKFPDVREVVFANMRLMPTMRK